MTDLSYECSFDTTIVLEDWISPNKYNCKIYFDVDTDSGDHQNIAFERIKIMLEAIFANSMIISMNNPLLQTLAKKTKQRIVTIPTEPLDVIMAAIIYDKLTAIVDGNLIVEKVKISSSQADNIWVHFDSEFAEVFTSLESELYKAVDVKPWWKRSDPTCSDWFEFSKKDVKFHLQKASWDKTLQWESTTASTEKPTPKWKPEVIDGGKDTKH
jgi:hypothetical protein